MCCFNEQDVSSRDSVSSIPELESRAPSTQKLLLKFFHVLLLSCWMLKVKNSLFLSRLLSTAHLSVRGGLRGLRLGANPSSSRFVHASGVSEGGLHPAAALMSVLKHTGVNTGKVVVFIWETVRAAR